MATLSLNQGLPLERTLGHATSSAGVAILTHHGGFRAEMKWRTVQCGGSDGAAVRTER